MLVHEPKINGEIATPLRGLQGCEILLFLYFHFRLPIKAVREKAAGLAAGMRER